MSASDRMVWLQTLSGGAAALAGLGITSLTVVYAVTPGPRLKKALEQVGPGLTRTLLGSLIGLVGAAAVFAAIMPWFGERPVDGVGLVVLAGVLFASLRASRLFWLFGRLLLVFVREASESTESTRPSAEWVPPHISETDYERPERDPVGR